MKRLRFNINNDGAREAHFKLIESGGMTEIINGTMNPKKVNGMMMLADGDGGQDGGGKQGKKNKKNDKKNGNGKGDGKKQQQGGQQQQQQPLAKTDGMTAVQKSQAADKAYSTKVKAMGLSAAEADKRITQARADRAWNLLQGKHIKQQRMRPHQRPQGSLDR